MTFFFQEDSAFGAHALCMQHSPNAAAPSTVFLLNYAPPPAARAERIDYKGHTAAWVWVVSQKDWRNQGAAGWILAMYWYIIWVKKMRFSCFPVLPGSAEANAI